MSFQRFWALEIHPGIKLKEKLSNRILRLTHASLDIKKESLEPKSHSLFIEISGKKHPLVTLQSGRLEQVSLNLCLDPNLEVNFEVNGNRSIHLFGFYEELIDMKESEEELEEGSRDEQANLEDVDEEDGKNNLESEEEISQEEWNKEEQTCLTKESSNNTQFQIKTKTCINEENNNLNQTKKRKTEEVFQPQSKKKKSQTQPNTQQTKQIENQTKEIQQHEKEESSEEEFDDSVTLQDSSTKPLATKILQKGLKIIELRYGNGPSVKPGHLVSITYIGRIGGHVFDASIKKPLNFRLGVGSVIKGLDLGLKGMKLGGRRKIIIPPHLGYGVSGSPPVVPPNATLEFEVEIIKC